MVIDLGHIQDFDSGEEIITWLNKNSFKTDKAGDRNIYFIRTTKQPEETLSLEKDYAKVNEIWYPFNVNHN